MRTRRRWPSSRETSSSTTSSFGTAAIRPAGPGCDRKRDPRGATVLLDDPRLRPRATDLTAPRAQDPDRAALRGLAPHAVERGGRLRRREARAPRPHPDRRAGAPAYRPFSPGRHRPLRPHLRSGRQRPVPGATGGGVVGRGGRGSQAPSGAGAANGGTADRRRYAFATTSSEAWGTWMSIPPLRGGRSGPRRASRRNATDRGRPWGNATYCVVGSLLSEVRDGLESDGHALAFHSFDHRLDRDDQLRRCRRSITGSRATGRPAR